MPSINHTTINSHPGRNGDSYWIAFDNQRKCIGNHQDIFKGKFNGNGPLRGQFAAVKVPRGEKGTARWCDTQIAINRKVYDAAKSFHKFLGLTSPRFHFTDSWKVLMDETCFFTDRIHHNEWVVVEEYMGKDMYPFIDNEGRAGFGNCEVLEAFVHWSYVNSGGFLIVCNLEGIYNTTFKLKTPTIHSMDSCYGFCDKGEAGISKILNEHRCNHICAEWNKPPSMNSALMSACRRRPSAPCLVNDDSILPSYSMACKNKIMFDRAPP
ncbi:hypothetical protein SNE40_017463 [Patella caerulea]|uniref:Alpha-type protein kinase domain-containing protein n=1 Tax=Patella caerulea TaxID=87958 RepID=A0AAN8JC73_PATCE